MVGDPTMELLITNGTMWLWVASVENGFVDWYRYNEQLDKRIFKLSYRELWRMP